MGIDKIPLDQVKFDPGNEVYTIGSLTVTKTEYANAEKINQIIDELRDTQDRLAKIEGK